MYLACLLLVFGQAGGHEWRPYGDGDSSGVLLYQGGKQIGAYVYSRDLYYPLDPETRKFGPPCPAPVTVPKRTNYGLIESKISRSDRITINGQESSVESAIRELTSPDARIPTATDKLRVTVIADPDKGQAAVDGIAKLFTDEEKNAFIVQTYPASHWSIQQAGYYCAGGLTVYFQKPDGEVLHREDNWDGDCSKLVQTLRRKRPNYNPLLDPMGGFTGAEAVKKGLPFAVPVLLLTAAAVAGLRKK